MALLLSGQPRHQLDSRCEDITVPPPQMAANLHVGNMDGFCVGESCGASAIFDKIGFTTTTHQIWADHPEKVLSCSRDFVEQNPVTARALVMALLDASRIINANDENK
nr:ABC transporter substrate-binding protein [Pseudomonas sp. BN515]